MSNITDMISEGHVDAYAAMFGAQTPRTYDTDEIVTNKDGGKQSNIGVRFDLIPARAIMEVAAVMKHGADKYGERNYMKIPVSDHINHGVRHSYAHLIEQQYDTAGNGYGTELAHAAARALIALEVYLAEQDESDEF